MLLKRPLPFARTEKPPLLGSDVATLLGRPLSGDDLPIARPAPLSECAPGDVVWVKEPTLSSLTRLRQSCPSLVICDTKTHRIIDLPRISSPQPRLDFIRVVEGFFKPPRVAAIHPTAIISPGAVIGKDPRIGPHVYVGPQVVIGDDCDIGSNVSIEGDVTIGNRCVIKSNSVLGDQGFGFEYDEDGIPQHFHHMGKVVLEDDVWIGACTHVGLATLGTTRIAHGAKVDDLVQVGHNSQIGPNTLVMANAVLCGGAEIGASCWIAPNSVIKQKVRIADHVTVGLGAVVISDITAEGVVVAGVPARPLPPKDESKG